MFLPAFIAVLSDHMLVHLTLESYVGAKADLLCTQPHFRSTPKCYVADDSACLCRSIPYPMLPSNLFVYNSETGRSDGDGLVFTKYWVNSQNRYNVIAMCVCVGLHSQFIDLRFTSYRSEVTFQTALILSPSVRLLIMIPDFTSPKVFLCFK